MLLVLNWKMNPATLAEAFTIFEATKKAAARAKRVSAIVAPPAVFLSSLAGQYKGRSLSFAVQNINATNTGAFTGEMSAPMAKSVGAAATLVGHAERRAMGETDDDVRKKVATGLTAGLDPIICIGERARDHSGEYLDVLKQQLAAAFADVSKEQIKHTVIAYEPVWAIGAEKPMDAHAMHEMTIFIRKWLWEKYEKVAQGVSILYGGAVLDGEHAIRMTRESEVDGLLLGRASVMPDKLSEMFSAATRA